ncbi:MAG: radical SAM protein [Deltaproteobacteria bacterium]|nr:radical SAM protein [Deltaproteobacteria bacterium]
MAGDPKHFYRRKSVERIAEEINDVRRRYPLTMAHFSDDLFNSGVGWLREFSAYYRKHVGVDFSANTYATFANEETVGLLADAGCKVLAVGLEVADDELRRERLNKPIRAARFREIAELLRGRGIKLVTFNMLGLPWGTVEQDIQTLSLNVELRATHTRVTVLTPFPKSRMTRSLIEDGYLAPDFEDRIYEVADLPAWPAESLFKRTEPVRTMRLLRLWHLAHVLRVPDRWVKKLIETRWANLLAPLSFLVALVNEKRIFGMSWLSGFRYFLHVKSPALKTSNYVSFI